MIVEHLPQEERLRLDCHQRLLLAPVILWSISWHSLQAERFCCRDWLELDGFFCSACEISSSL